MMIPMDEGEVFQRKNEKYLSSIDWKFRENNYENYTKPALYLTI